MNTIHLISSPPLRTYAGDILIVDDTPDNLRLLSTILTEHNYKVRRVVSGNQALDAVSLNPPELILLDILMPGMSGFEVCERLKSDPLTAEIPIIFLSALNDSDDKTKAFSIGGSDYITKPFQLLEVLARVKHQITLKNQRQLLHHREQQLEELNQALASKVEDRTEAIGRLLNQLQTQIKDRVESDQRTRQQDLEAAEIKSRFIDQIFHEFRTPLSIISLLAESLADDSLSQDQRSQSIEQIIDNVQRINTVLTNFTSLESHRESTFTRSIPRLSLAEFFESKIKDWQQKAGDRFEIEYRLLSDLPSSICLEPSLIEQALEQIIANSIRFSPQGGKILVSVASNQTVISITIQDWGIGIPENEQQHVFEPSYRARNANSIQGTPGLGIGLTIAKQVVEIQGGKIEIKSELNLGTTVSLTLPYVNAT